MGKVRIAVAGAGLIGLRHIEEIEKSRSARLAAIVDVSPKAGEVAKQSGVPLYGSLTELFGKDRPDGVILATPNQLHAAQGLECVAARVPALVEKPVADNLQDGIELCDAAKRADVKLLVGHHRRHSPILHKAVEIVKSGILGSIVAVLGGAVFYKPDSEGYYEGPNAWRKERGGGPILINLIHEIDNLRATKSWEQTSQENKAYPTYEDEDAYTIIGASGSLGVPTMRLKYYERNEDRSWYRPFKNRVVPLERADPLANQIEQFAAVIRGEQEPLVTCRDGLQNLRVTDAISEAARTGQVVSTA